ncbi:ATP-binding protein, partial [Altibacter sp.]|uniref:ATP-binding protein n=1 Tax=Altibacter sp. TaxID=2024823 RepID=UPI002582A5A2
GQIFFETHFFPLIKMQGFVNEVYFDVVRKDNSIFHALINAREIPSKSRQKELFQATILDISDRWKYEKELLHAKRKAEADSKAKAEFLSTISHEIRTPLNTILGIGHLLHETPLNENQKEYARLLLHSSENLLSLVNNLLDLSKIEAQKVTLEQMPFHLGELLELMHETFSVRARAKGIQLDISIAKNVPKHLTGDPVKLNQILTNLIGNAIKFTKTGTVQLAVTVERKKAETYQIHFSVSDTGIGIPPEKLEAIFQEFSQASYDVSVEFGGTGLGLTICQKLLELHQSKMEVKSTLGKGSTFSFSIWYTAADTPSPTRKGKKERKNRLLLKDMDVLVVDDNPDNIFIATQYLDQWEVPYATAESGKKALDMVRKRSFDLILLDLQMPKMDGYETARKLRSLPLKTQPVIVAFSASAAGEVADLLEAAGIDDHLSKPFKPKDFMDTLLEHSSHRKKISADNVNLKPSVAASEGQKKKKTKAASEDTPNTVSFKIDRYAKMANDRPEYIKKFVLSTLDAFATYKQDFQNSVKTKDPEGFSNLIHKSTMSFYYIEADRLGSLLMACRDALQEDAADDATFKKLAAECQAEFDTIIRGLTHIGET